jgi:hypothetical protein
MLFVSPLNDTIVVSDLKGCGQKDSKKYGRYESWVIQERNTHSFLQDFLIKPKPDKFA